MGKSIPKPDLLADLRRVNGIVEQTVGRYQYEDHGTYNHQTILNRFGSWDAAREAAGIEGNPLSEWASGRTGADNPNYKGGMVTLECTSCGADVERKPSVAEKKDRHFCNQACYHAWRADHHTGENHPRYNSVAAECANCGAELTRQRSEVESRARLFCDPQCAGEWRSENTRGEASPSWKGGYEPYYGENWPEQRAKALDRDGHACLICGMPSGEHRERFGKAIEVHHVRPVRAFDRPEDANTLDNLVTLCIVHHKQWEGIPLRPAVGA